MKATAQDYKETIHTIEWTVSQLIAMGLPADKAEAAAKWCKKIAAVAVEDTQRASRIDTVELFQS